MSEKEVKTESTGENITSDNVALLKAKEISLESLIEDYKKKLSDMTDRALRAEEFVIADKKKELLADIIPRVKTPKELLMLKSVDELKAIKKVLDDSTAPVFKSGAPLSYDHKPTQRQKLNDIHKEYMAKLRGGKQ